MAIQLAHHVGHLCVRCSDQNEKNVARGVWPARWHEKWGCFVLGFGPLGLHNIVVAAKRAGVDIQGDTRSRELLKAFRAAMTLRGMPFETGRRLDGIRTLPWPHQVRGFDLAKDMPGFQLQMDMGTGKTLVALGLLAHWARGQRGKRVLVVCPKSVIDVWPGEFDKHMLQETRVSFVLNPLNQRTVAAKASAADRAEDLAFQRGQIVVHIINYDAVWRPEMERWLKKKDLLALVMDEGHRIKSPSGRAARFMGALMEQSERRLALTGTPMPHSPLDIFAQYRALSKDVFGTVWGDFRNRYAVMGGFENKQVIGFQNERDMNSRVDAISFRVKKSDVLSLPPVMHERRPVELCASAKAVYKSMQKDLWAMVGEVEATAANALVKIVRLLQITSGVLQLDDGSRQEIDDSKMRGFTDLVEDLPENEPLVVFSRFTRDLEIIRGALAERGRTCAILDGHQNQLAEWQRGEFRDIAIQIRAGGAGVDLTRACYAVYFTQTHSLGDYEQSLARLDRPGQKLPVTYYHLVSTGTIDEKIYAALQAKRDVVEYILEGIKNGA